MIDDSNRLAQMFPWHFSYVSRCPSGWLVSDGQVRVFGIGSSSVARDSVVWNDGSWRRAFGVSDNLFFWGENVFGDQFGVDATGRLCVMRCEGGELESVAGAGFDDLVKAELVQLQQPGSASLLAAVSRSGLWPSPTQHVGFLLPLVVGGSCEIENVEIVDAEIHLAILAEIVAKTAAVADGTKIAGFTN